jgi:hypothetical protein
VLGKAEQSGAAGLQPGTQAVAPTHHGDGAHMASVRAHGRARCAGRDAGAGDARETAGAVSHGLCTRVALVPVSGTGPVSGRGPESTGAVA